MISGIKTGKAMMPTALSEVTRTADLKRESVLVVDDDEGLRGALAIGLKRDGYQVTLACDALVADRLMAAGTFDLILLDIRLPGVIGGLELLRQIRQEHSPLNLPVIIISGSADAEMIVAALRDGANDYVTKPFDASTVRARVHTQITLKGLKDVNDHFLRTASHDLKKPIMLMLDVAQQLRLSMVPGAAVSADDVSALDLLIDSARYMQKIISELVDVGAMRAGRVRLRISPTDFGALVRQAVAHNAGYGHNKDIEIGLRFASGIPRIEADELRILQILDNLIGNAIKFSPRSTVIIISTWAADGFITCEVSDQGPGLSQKDITQLFQPYATLSNKPTGHEHSTGLGLAICKELVTLHRGSIGARNNPDRGATFWIRIPTERPPDAPDTSGAD